jgi:hypothetical protein
LDVRNFDAGVLADKVEPGFPDHRTHYTQLAETGKEKSMRK